MLALCNEKSFGQVGVLFPFRSHASKDQHIFGQTARCYASKPFGRRSPLQRLEDSAGQDRL